MVDRLIRHNSEGKNITINTWFAFITLILLVTTSLVSIVALTVNAASDIDRNTESIDKLTMTVKGIDEKLNNNENRINIVETHYLHIKEQLDRIEEKITK